MTKVSKPSTEELNKLREAGLTRIQIAVKYDVPLSTVKKWLRDIDIVPRSNKAEASKPRVRVREKDRNAKLNQESLMEKAKNILGDRMTEKRHIGYLLDGRPVSSWRIAQAAGLDVEK